VKKGLTGRVEVLPAGTEVVVTAALGPAAGSTDRGGVLSLQIFDDHVGPEKRNLLVTQDITRTIPWPSAGTVLLAANTPLSFATQCGCPYMMSISEFRKRAAARAAAPAGPALARVIPMNSRLAIVLLEPVTVSGIQAGQRFHAQLSADMELPYGLADRGDALQLRRGTDVYLKVLDTNYVLFGQRQAKLSVDYALLNGVHIALKTDEWTLPYSLPTANRTGRVQPTEPVWPTGHAVGLSVLEQTDVPAAALGSEGTPAYQTAGPTVGVAPPPQPATSQPNPVPGAPRGKAGAIGSAARPRPN
jgi:hypothetical protein